MMDGTGTPVFEMSLADRVQAGEREAEEELVQRFYRKVLVMAIIRVGDRQVALDIAQETMIGVLEALRQSRVNDQQHLAGYVYGTARNLINNHFRVRARTKTEGAVLDREVAKDDPEQEAAERERLEMVERALAELKPDDREILRMTLVDGLKPGEIAARTGCTDRGAAWRPGEVPLARATIRHASLGIGIAGIHAVVARDDTPAIRARVEERQRRRCRSVVDAPVRLGVGRHRCVGRSIVPAAGNQED